MMFIFRHKLLLALTSLAFLVTSPLLASYPTARTSSKMVYDPTSGRIILFGGLTSPDDTLTTYELGDTWAWTGTHWLPLYPAHSPAARDGQTMVFDAARSQVILFAGISGVTGLNDTWAFKNGDWRQVITSNAPSGRGFAAGAFDPVTNRVILYGGGTTTNDYDTWAFDGSNWEQLTDNSPQIGTPVMTYDQARQQILLLGVDPTTNATLMFNWTGTNWAPMTPAHLPDCIKQGALAYEAYDEKVNFASGICTNVAFSNETWQWDGTDWTKLDLIFTQGLGSAMALDYDPFTQETVLFGGYNGRAVSFTYRFHITWAPYTEETSPGPRSIMAFENDPARGVSWMFGGHNDQGHLSDFWELSNGNWTKINADSNPVGCFFPSAAMDTDRGRMVMICDNSSTYEWDGTTWTATNPKTKPDLRRWGPMVYDSHLKKVILYGGFNDASYLDETWTWDGTNWTRVGKGKKAPPARSLPAMFYDPISQKTYVFGGIGQPTTQDAITRYDDMWSFDGTAWTQLKTLTVPLSRYGPLTRFDPDLQKTIMFGGKDQTEHYMNEEWEWDGAAWTQVVVPAPPTPRMNAGFIYDSAASRMLMFGGWSGQEYSELWQLTGEGDWVLQQEREGRRRRPVGPTQ